MEHGLIETPAQKSLMTTRTDGGFLWQDNPTGGRQRTMKNGGF